MAKNKGIGHLKSFKLNFNLYNQPKLEKSNLPYLLSGIPTRYKFHIFVTTLVKNGGRSYQNS